MPTPMERIHGGKYAGHTEADVAGLDKSPKMWNNMCTLLHEMLTMNYDTCSSKQEQQFMAYYAYFLLFVKTPSQGIERR